MFPSPIDDLTGNDKESTCSSDDDSSLMEFDEVSGMSCIKKSMHIGTLRLLMMKLSCGILIMM